MLFVASFIRFWQLATFSCLFGMALVACGQRAKTPPFQPMLPAAAASPATDLFALAAAPCTADGYFVNIHASEFVRPDGAHSLCLRATCWKAAGARRARSGRWAMSGSPRTTPPR